MNAWNIGLMKHQLNYFQQEYLLTENTTTDNCARTKRITCLHIVNGLFLFQVRLTSYHLNYKNAHSSSNAFKFKAKHEAVSPCYDNVTPEIQHCFKRDTI